MTDETNLSRTQARPAVGANGHGLLARMAIRALDGLVSGRLTITMPGGQSYVFGGNRSREPHGVVAIHDTRVFRRMLLGGDMGLAASYLDGDWSTPDLSAVFDLAIANEHCDAMWDHGQWFHSAFNRIAHRLRSNTRRGSRRNIAHHYDLGNDFYAAWLDPSMTYSSAIFETPGEDLGVAQARKYRRILDMAGIESGDSVLEIGCGWGSFAQAATERGASVRGITLSREQLAWCRDRKDIVPNLARFDYCDYRDAEGTYDHIVSIEMIEAVGVENWPVYFETIRERLRPGGTAVIQAILIEDDRFEDYSRGTDFIQRYIFPGGVLLSQKVLAEHVEKAGLVLDGVETFGRSYEQTLMHWHRAFQNAWPRISRMGMDDRFKRMWEYYLCYCAAGFRAGNIDVGLFRIERPA